MGLFTSQFEKALFYETFEKPFSGYCKDNDASVSDYAFDLCASIGHNQTLFPNGVVLRKHQERVFYSAYAMSVMLAAMNAPEGEAEQAAQGVQKGYTLSAFQSGASRSLVFERITLIANEIQLVNGEIDRYEGDAEKQEHAFKAGFLSRMGVEINDDTMNAISDEIEQFNNHFKAFLKAHS